ncbi:MAG: non-heme iron oxygenase ferredoxin subunit [Deinococcus sp.]|nr:non-heme iron oxygenase ferredoxin subunit [Deinococcus sp.]
MAEFVKVANTSDLAPGQVKLVEVGERWVALFNVGGQFYAIEDRCTHDDGPLAEGMLDGHVIMCPRHGATFDVRTGAALTFPAVTPVPAHEVKIEGDAVLVSTQRKRK